MSTLSELNSLQKSCDLDNSEEEQCQTEMLVTEPIKIETNVLENIDSGFNLEPL